MLQIGHQGDDEAIIHPPAAKVAPDPSASPVNTTTFLCHCCVSHLPRHLADCDL